MICSFTRIEHDLAAGDLVAVRPYGSREWVPARLRQNRPYRHRSSVVDGWYVQYLLAVEQWDCHGGWVPTTSVVALGEVVS